MTNFTNNKISYEEYDLMWFELKEGNITEAEWREFCNMLFDQMIDVVKDAHNKSLEESLRGTLI
jgi:hypothetical protein